MSHVIEPATSSRAKCRGCARAIAKAELRLGERLPNPFAEAGEMTLWFHLQCAAYKRPEALLEALAAHAEGVDERAWLEAAARRGLTHPRLQRLDGAERAPSGRALCRSCREPIASGAWRLRLVFFEQGRFDPGGFVHAGCARAYFEGQDAAAGADVLARAVHFSGAIDDAGRDELAHALGVA